MSSGPTLVAVAFKTLGCKVNRVEAEAIAAELLGSGAIVVDEDEARVVVVNTCTVTREADAKARKAVRHALGRPLGPLVVVTGCLAALDETALSELGERVVVESDKARVASRVRELLGIEGHAFEECARSGAGFRTRAMIKVEDGCDAFCRYCIVPYARGVPRSVRQSDILTQAQQLVDSGVREIVLTGINIGRYRDEETGSDLADVIAAVGATSVERLRLSSIEPRDLTERFLSAVATTRAFCPHLHVPLQSGNDAVLSAMGRNYTTAEYAALITAARNTIPGLAITTDVMAGFPGEGETHAADSLAFCRSMGFRKMHVFRYSKRPGTPAAESPDQVVPAEKNSRALALRELGAQMWREDVESFIGENREVLVERVVPTQSGEFLVQGTTRDYLRVSVSVSASPSGLPRVGDLVDVRLTAVAGENVLAEMSVQSY